MNVVLTIIRAGELVGTLAPIGIELANRIKALLMKDPEISITLQALQDGTIRTADESRALINAWLASHP